MKKLLLVCTFLLWTTPIWAQDVIPTLKQARTLYPARPSKAQVSEMLNRAAAEHPGWGMLRKDAGNNCPTPYPGVAISCDWMVYAPTRWGYDLIIDSDGVAGIVDSSGGESLSAGMEIVYPWPVTSPTPTPGPTPPPTPTPNTDLSAVLQGLADLRAALGVPPGDSIFAQAERVFGQAQAVAAEQKAEHAAIAEKVDNPGWFKQVFGNRYVQVLLATVATYIGTNMAHQ